MRVFIRPVEPKSRGAAMSANVRFPPIADARLLSESGNMVEKYDIIGINYAELRRPDPRIGAAIEEALGQAETVLNVGAGTGSYEPAGRRVTAV